jgi:hypothetical protein
MIASAPQVSDQSVSIDQLLAVAMPAEVVRYHANAVAEAMAVMHPSTTANSPLSQARGAPGVISQANQIR